MRLNELKDELLRRPTQSDGKGFYQRLVQQPVLSAGEECVFNGRRQKIRKGFAKTAVDDD